MLATTAFFLVTGRTVGARTVIDLERDDASERASE
jgi:hypothetical protein